MAYVPERWVTNFPLGRAIVLRKTGVVVTPHYGTVVELGPLMKKFRSVRPTPSVPAWGRRIVVKVDKPMELLPGEAFRVTPRWGFLLAALALGHDPTPLRVSESLLAIPVCRKLRVWCGIPTLSRYLVVSDDTGSKKKAPITRRGSLHSAAKESSMRRRFRLQESKNSTMQRLCSGPDDTLFWPLRTRKTKGTRQSCTASAVPAHAGGTYPENPGIF